MAGQQGLFSLLLYLSACIISEHRGEAKESCTSGFISLDNITAVYADTGSFDGQYRFPNTNFSCNGLITGWSALAYVYDKPNGHYPELQVWRNTGNGMYIKVGNTTLSGGEYSRGDTDIFMTELESPLEFQDGDIFGMFQPKFYNSVIKIISQEDINRSRHPFVSVTASPQECTHGFVTKERLQEVLNYHDNFGYYASGFTYHLDTIFPCISFTCNGHITKLIGELRNNRDNSSTEIQVWRRINTTFYKVGSTAIDSLGDHWRPYIYQYTIDPPLPVQAGDVLGFYWGDLYTRHLLQFLRAPKPVESCYTLNCSSSDTEESILVTSICGLPLITVEIEPTTKHLLLTPTSLNHCPTSSQATLTLSSTSSQATLTQLPISSQATPTPSSAIATPSSSSLLLPIAIVVGLIGGGAITLALILIVVFKCFSCGERYKEDSNAEEVEMDRNEAYVVPRERIPTAHSEAYGVLSSVPRNVFDSSVSTSQAAQNTEALTQDHEYDEIPVLGAGVETNDGAIANEEVVYEEIL